MTSVLWYTRGGKLSIGMNWVFNSLKSGSIGIGCRRPFCALVTRISLMMIVALFSERNHCWMTRLGCFCTLSWWESRSALFSFFSLSFWFIPGIHVMVHSGKFDFKNRERREYVVNKGGRTLLAMFAYTTALWLQNRLCIVGVVAGCWRAVAAVGNGCYLLNRYSALQCQRSS